MSTIDDLDYKSISEISRDEAIELLRQIRLSRRTPAKTAKKKSTPKQKKASSPENLSPEQAAELLKILGGME